MNSFKRENTVPVRQVKILQPNHQPSRIGVQLLDICSWNIPGADVESKMAVAEKFIYVFQPLSATPALRVGF